MIKPSVTEMVANIQRLNSRINAIISQPAKPVYRTPVNNSRLLEGYAVSVKDIFCTDKDLARTTCSSMMLRDFRAGYNATVVDLLLDAGASLIGKTNMDEFGMGSHNVHSIHGPVINPLYADEERSAGGSSGGSAASVAAEFCHLSISTDTGGSTRLPAAYCGILGFKPSYGRLSRHGLIAYASSLDTVGLMAREINVLCRAFRSLDRHDPYDPTSLGVTRRNQLRELEEKDFPPQSRPLVIGVPQDYWPEEFKTQQDGNWGAFNQLLNRLERVDGVKLRPVYLPHSRFSTAAYYIIASAEASSNLARYDGIRYGHRSKRDPIFYVNDPEKSVSYEEAAQAICYTRDEGFGQEVKRRIILGNYVLSAQQYDRFFLQAQRIRRLVQRDFNQAFRVPHLDSLLFPSDNDSTDDINISEKVDLLITPVSAQQKPPLISELAESVTESYLTDIFTTPPSLAGLPCISVPLGGTSAQLIGQYGCDETVLSAAERLLNEL